tara:strand:+ start:737 stop:994 length:258 start_codon:yes stop_codon:yes gene_type:complete
MLIIRDEPIFLIYAAGLLLGLSVFDEILLEKSQYLILVLFVSGVSLAVIFKDSMPSIFKVGLGLITMFCVGVFLRASVTYLLSNT